MKLAVGMVETRGLVTLFEAVDAMLKAATVEFTAWEPVGSGLVTAFVEGEMAAVKSATDAGAEAAAQLGEVVSVQVITRPHDDLAQMLASFGKKKYGQWRARAHGEKTWCWHSGSSRPRAWSASSRRPTQCARRRT